MSINVSQFELEELSVVVKGNDIIVEGHHREKGDEGGTVERHFTRKFYIPSEVDVEDLQSSLSQDGILTVTAPRKSRSNMRQIQISKGSPSKSTPSKRSPAKSSPSKRLPVKSSPSKSSPSKSSPSEASPSKTSPSKKKKKQT